MERGQLAASSLEQVDEWHAAGLGAGDSICEAVLEFAITTETRPIFAYLRDPAGNNSAPSAILAESTAVRLHSFSATTAGRFLRDPLPG